MPPMDFLPSGPFATYALPERGRRCWSVPAADRGGDRPSRRAMPTKSSSGGRLLGDVRLAGPAELSARLPHAATMTAERLELAGDAPRHQPSRRAATSAFADGAALTRCGRGRLLRPRPRRRPNALALRRGAPQTLTGRRQRRLHPPNGVPGRRIAIALGMGIVQRAGPLKSPFMAEAGGRRRMPLLLRGLAI